MPPTVIRRFHRCPLPPAPPKSAATAVAATRAAPVATSILAFAGYTCYDCANSHGTRDASVAKPAAQLIDELAHTRFEFKGANIGAWTDLVCFAPQALR